LNEEEYRAASNDRATRIIRAARAARTLVNCHALQNKQT